MTTAKRSRKLPVAQKPEVVHQYALDFYAALEAKAGTEDIQGRECLIFRGGLAKVYDTLGASRTYYSRVRGSLEELGAIQILQRGNPRQGTVIALYGAPTLEALESSYYLTSPSERRKMTTDVDKRVTVIERRLGKELNYVTVIENLEQRISALEKKVGNGKTA